MIRWGGLSCTTGNAKIRDSEPVRMRDCETSGEPLASHPRGDCSVDYG